MKAWMYDRDHCHPNSTSVHGVPSIVRTAPRAYREMREPPAERLHHNKHRSLPREVVPHTERDGTAHYTAAYGRASSMPMECNTKRLCDVWRVGRSKQGGHGDAWEVRYQCTVCSYIGRQDKSTWSRGMRHCPKCGPGVRNRRKAHSEVTGLAVAAQVVPFPAKLTDRSPR